jgi:hypothetical protein
VGSGALTPRAGLPPQARSQPKRRSRRGVEFGATIETLRGQPHSPVGSRSLFLSRGHPTRGLEGPRQWQPKARATRATVARAHCDGRRSRTSWPRLATKRHRYDLHRAKMYSSRPTTMTPLRELERAAQGAEARLSSSPAAGRAAQPRLTGDHATHASGGCRERRLDLVLLVGNPAQRERPRTLSRGSGVGTTWVVATSMLPRPARARATDDCRARTVPDHSRASRRPGHHQCPAVDQGIRAQLE